MKGSGIHGQRRPKCRNSAGKGTECDSAESWGGQGLRCGTDPVKKLCLSGHAERSMLYHCAAGMNGDMGRGRGGIGKTDGWVGP